MQLGTYLSIVAALGVWSPAGFVSGQTISASTDFWAPQSVSSEADTRERTITGDAYVGCVSREDLTRLGRYAAQQDLEGLELFLQETIPSGRCVLFQEGERVFITETALLRGIVRVRREGGIEEYWVNFEAVRQ